MRLVLTWAGLTACNEHPIVHTELDRFADARTGMCTPARSAVDVLIVVDDSASMVQEQPNLAENLGAIADVYEQAADRLDYRIAVVPASMAHPGCEGPGGDGAFSADPCTDRLDDFVVTASGEGPGADTRDVCLDACDGWALQLEPPWIERIEGVSNLPAGGEIRQALACMGLQGVGGCRFQSPLEAMRAAILRAEDPEDAAFGFLRPHAGLFVMFVGDGMDCSAGPAGEALFSAPGATAATCWDAGIVCDADRNCRPVDRDGSGAATEPDGAALLHPLDGYLELLRGIDRQKQVVVPGIGRRVFVSTVGAMPAGGWPVYPPPADEGEAATFGVGLGCSTAVGQGHPAPRLFEMATVMAEGFQFEHWSICSDDFRPAVACLPGPSLPPPSCLPCVSDRKPTVPGVQPECIVHETTRDGTVLEVPPCEDTPERPEGHDRCFRILTDDAMSDECASEGANAQATIVWGDVRPDASCYEVVCTQSQRPLLDCPGQI